MKKLVHFVIGLLFLGTTAFTSACDVICPLSRCYPGVHLDLRVPGLVLEGAHVSMLLRDDEGNSYGTYVLCDPEETGGYGCLAYDTDNVEILEIEREAEIADGEYSIWWWPTEYFVGKRRTYWLEVTVYQPSGESTRFTVRMAPFVEKAIDEGCPDCRRAEGSFRIEPIDSWAGATGG